MSSGEVGMLGLCVTSGTSVIIVTDNRLSEETGSLLFISLSSMTNCGGIFLVDGRLLPGFPGTAFDPAQNEEKKSLHRTSNGLNRLNL